MEIERKYLVASLPQDLEHYEHTEIEQCYLCTSPTLRIRRAGDVFILTVKERVRHASTAAINREEEFLLDEEHYTQLKSKCEGNPVCKTRYRIPIGQYTAELDLFHNEHEGLRIVEVEFPNVEAADSFCPPQWFGQDVSADPHYRNTYLANIE